MVNVFLSKEEITFIKELSNNIAESLGMNEKKDKIIAYITLKYQALKFREQNGLGDIDSNKLQDVLLKKISDNIFCEYRETNEIEIEQEKRA